MSGSPACLYVLLIVQVGLFHQQLKVFCKKTASTQPADICLCWCVVPQFSSHLLLRRQKDEYCCALLEAVPRLVILRYLLQLVLVVVHFFFFFSFFFFWMATLLLKFLFISLLGMCYASNYTVKFGPFLYTGVKTSMNYLHIAHEVIFWEHIPSRFSLPQSWNKRKCLALS